MSLFFRSRSGPPRKLRRKSAGKTLHKTPVPMLDLGPDPMPATFPGPRAALAPVRHTPRRRGQRAIGYGTTGAPGQRMFRVT
jgi:hypothetical protein